jgi:hypothetical protein
MLDTDQLCGRKSITPKSQPRSRPRRWFQANRRSDVGLEMTKLHEPGIMDMLDQAKSTSSQYEIRHCHDSESRESNTRKRGVSHGCVDGIACFVPWVCRPV